MAKYKISSRRKKAAPETEAPVSFEQVTLPTEPIHESDSNEGVAAFALFEEFFGKNAEEVQASARELKADAPDLIDPDSVEPTREFDPDEVRRGVLSAAEQKRAESPVSAPEPAEPTESAAGATDEPAPIDDLFAGLFGTKEEPKKKRSLFSKKDAPLPSVVPAASVGVQSAATIPLPDVKASDTIQVPAFQSSDTIPLPDVTSPSDAVAPADLSGEADTVYAPELSATRANIQDLIADAAVEEDVSAAEIDDEFTSLRQAEDLFLALHQKSVRLWRRFGLIALLFVLCVYLECAAFLKLPLPEWLSTGRFGSVHLLADLQLVLLALALCAGNFWNGLKALFVGRATASSPMAVSLLVSLIHPIALLCIAPASTDFMLFGCVSIFLCGLSLIREILKTRGTARTLLILSSDKVKYAAAKAPEQSAELKSFADFIGEEVPEVFCVSRTDFVDGFSRRTESAERSVAAITVALPLSLLASAFIAVWCHLGESEPNYVHTVGAFVVSMMMSIPACSLFLRTLPFFFAQRRAAKTGTALIGEDCVEECAGAEILSFDDTEVFLPKHVKVTSVRTYGNARIDKILIYCAQIFRIVGGPLSFVFENSISSLSIPGHVEILENDGRGICARIDGKEIYVGSADYMKAYGFEPESDPNDLSFENTVGRIMYLATDDELSAKFYIKYAVSARFCSQLKMLNRAGIYATIKTCDPNIDNVLLSKILHSDEYPIGVVKTASAAANAPATEREDAPIAGISKISGVLNGFLLCDAVRQRDSLNTLIKFVSMLLGLFIAFVLTGMQNSYLTPLVCLMYQAMWIVPVFVPALFDWPTVRRPKKK